MTDMMMDRRELLLRNRDTVKQVFPWDSGMMHLCCGNVYTMRGLAVDEASLAQAKKLLTDRVGVFSNFRSTARNVLIAMLDASGDGERLLDRSLELYDLLKREFFTSSYLPMVAMLLAEQADPARWDEIISRTRDLYDRMRREHPMLTSSEDCALCALLAMSEQSDDELIDRMEEAYHTLKKLFPMSGEGVQSLSHVLALTPGDIQAKCARIASLVDALKQAGHRWYGGYELPVLGVLVEDERSDAELVAEIIRNDDWLKAQKGFGFFSSVSRMQRLMYAALLTQHNNTAAQTAAVTGTIATIIAQEVAMIAVVSASVAASSSSSH